MRFRRTLQDAALTALLWVVAALATIALQNDLGAVLLLWAPSGVAVAGFRYVRRRHWPVLAAIMLPTMSLTLFAAGYSLGFSAAYAVSAIVQSVICAGLSVMVLGSRLAKPSRIVHVVGLFGAAVAACLVGALMAFPFRPEQSLAEFVWWFLANVLGILIVTPAILQLGEVIVRWRKRSEAHFNGELLLGLAGCALLCGIALNVEGVSLMPLLVAAMIFMAARYGHAAISSTLIVYALVATMLSLDGANPVAFLEVSRDEGVVLVQSWLLTLFATALPISAMLLKRDELQFELIRRNSGMHENLMILDLAEQIAGIGRWRLDLVSGEQDWSPRMLEMYGLPPELAPDPGDIRHFLPDGGKELFEQIADHRDDRDPYQFDYRIKPSEGVERILRISILNEFDMAGQRIALFGVAIDVTEQVHRVRALDLARGRAVRLAAEAQKLANTDPLTSLPNRRCTFARLSSMVEVARKRGAPLTAVMFDIDHFKQVNDTYGHQTGDEVIVMVAELARRQARQGDVVGRIGGEEFVWLLPGIDAAAARGLAERLRGAVEEGIEGSALPNVTISVGLAQLVDGDDGDAVLARADAALYEAKESGRNRVRRAA